MPNQPQPRAGAPGEVLAAFVKLGLSSFGGPIAHLGYFRDELVQRRRWISEEGYAELVALCQFLPGPASSKVGFALGLLRAGPLGAAAAWVGFTLPSALLLIAFASFATLLEPPLGQGLVHGLKLVAVAIVAQAIWGMARSLTPDRERAAIALAALLLAIFAPTGFNQILAILAGGAAGLWLCRKPASDSHRDLSFGIPKRVGLLFLTAFFGLLIGLPLAASGGADLSDMLNAYYRSGALVFGGGHVVLPLLEQQVVQTGWVSPDAFLAGYGATQAVPGPLFTFAAYLGFIGTPWPNGWFGAAIALGTIFLPGFLLLLGVIPFWGALRHQPLAQAGLRGANAAVVGILAAAFYNPVWTSAVLSPRDFAIALAGFLALTMWKVPPLMVVLALAGIGLLTGLG